MKTFFITTILSIYFSLSANAQNTSDHKLIKYDSYVSFISKKVLKTTLYFNQYESYFDWNNIVSKSENKVTTKEEQIDAKNTNITIKKTIKSDSIPQTNYKSLKDKKVVTRIRWIDGNSYVIHEGLPQINWKIENEEKQISNFNCKKATTTFRGRKYTAWFTFQIPVSSGPWKLQGLPGMILEAYDSKKEVWFGATEISSTSLPSNISQDIFKDPKSITIQEYAEMQKNPYSSLVDMEALEKKLKSKLPRGSSLDIKIKKSSNFLEQEFEFDQN